eukprot:gnl/Dysnectes_brevis/948_a1057_1991.p1 GENE.gnl/Dysnectes_brevis/948_a1057_1991~~gnl/Dysnectes_brevis/948_a1057_1991.p1  ORF type:complete len:639 (+),score=263.70 gnl/Dysnectes_brevis/948_a1057_1991:65-1981(+)
MTKASHLIKLIKKLCVKKKIDISDELMTSMQESDITSLTLAQSWLQEHLTDHKDVDWMSEFVDIQLPAAILDVEQYPIIPVNEEQTALCKCESCGDILVQNITLTPCGHILDGKCAIKHLSGESLQCPVCSKRVDFISADKRVVKAVSSLPVFCPMPHMPQPPSIFSFSPKCVWRGRVRSIVKHVHNDCPFTVIPCPHGCGMDIRRGDLPIHEEDCPDAPCPCEWCGEVMAQHALPEHKEACTSRPTQCKFAKLGCPWEGPMEQLETHLAVCGHCGRKDEQPQVVPLPPAPPGRQIHPAQFEALSPGLGMFNGRPCEVRLVDAPPLHDMRRLSSALEALGSSPVVATYWGFLPELENAAKLGDTTGKVALLTGLPYEPISTDAHPLQRLRACLDLLGALEHGWGLGLTHGDLQLHHLRVGPEGQSVLCGWTCPVESAASADFNALSGIAETLLPELPLADLVRGLLGGLMPSRPYEFVASQLWEQVPPAYRVLLAPPAGQHHYLYQHVSDAEGLEDTLEAFGNPAFLHGSHCNDFRSRWSFWNALTTPTEEHKPAGVSPFSGCSLALLPFRSEKEYRALLVPKAPKAPLAVHRSLPQGAMGAMVAVVPDCAYEEQDGVMMVPLPALVAPISVFISRKE